MTQQNIPEIAYDKSTYLTSINLMLINLIFKPVKQYLLLKLASDFVFSTTIIIKE